MKADTGGWFYIVLSIAFIIISALGKNKKKTTASLPPIKEPVPAHPEEKKWPRTLEDILSEVLDIPKPQEVVIANKEPVPLESNAKNLPVEVLNPTAPKQEVTPIPERKVEPIYKDSESAIPAFFENGLDLRQGIIYSEILNRKYF